MIIRDGEITVLIRIAGQVVLGLVALLRVERNDIPTVLQEISGWWDPGS
jgi:hypothetical protein